MFVRDHLRFLSEYEYLWTPKPNKREKFFKRIWVPLEPQNKYANIHGNYSLASSSNLELSICVEISNIIWFAQFLWILPDISGIDEI